MSGKVSVFTWGWAPRRQPHNVTGVGSGSTAQASCGWRLRANKNWIPESVETARTLCTLSQSLPVKLVLPVTPLGEESQKQCTENAPGLWPMCLFTWLSFMCPFTVIKPSCDCNSLLQSSWWGLCLFLTNYRTWGWSWGLPKLASVRREGGLKTQNSAVSVQSEHSLNRLFANFTRWFTPCSIYFHYSFSLHCLTSPPLNSEHLRGQGCWL